MKLRLALFLLVGLSVGIYGAYNYFTGWKWAFQQSPSLVFYSLHTDIPLITHPPLPIDKVPGLVMDKVVVSDATDKEELIEATRQARTPVGQYSISKCFDPRHAVSTADGQTVVLLCFECGQAQIITPRGNSMMPINRSVRPLFDSLIRKYNLKAAPAD